MKDKHKPKGRKQDKPRPEEALTDVAERTGLKRFEMRFVVPLDVKAPSEAQASLIAMRALVDMLLNADVPDAITVYPPQPVAGNDPGHGGSQAVESGDPAEDADAGGQDDTPPAALIDRGRTFAAADGGGDTDPGA
jgi:hypothetical protein